MELMRMDFKDLHCMTLRCLSRQNWLKKNCGMNYGIFRARKVPNDKGSSRGGVNGKFLINFNLRSLFCYNGETNLHFEKWRYWGDGTKFKKI